MNKRVLTIIGMLLLLIAVPVGVYYLRQQQDIRSHAAPATTLSFSPAVIAKKQGDIFSLDVVVNTGTNTISAADLAINSDPTQVKITGMTLGTFLTTTLLAQSVTDSKATVTLGSPPTSPKQGTGTLVTVQFQVVGTSGNAQINFTGSQVAGIGETGNVLLGMGTASVTMSSSGTGSTPTPTPTGTTGNTPTPTPTGTGSLTETPTPTGTVMPTDTTTGTPTPTPSDNGSGQVTVSSPTANQTLPTNTPTFTGNAPAGSTVTITIYSDPITATVTADANGQWSYTVGSALPDGQHQIVVSSLLADGTTASTSTSFYVTTQPLPQTGSMDFFNIPVGIGSLLVILGILL